jgi:tripartite-type tricarboxylate transporter receptor subunit TctC
LVGTDYLLPKDVPQPILDRLTNLLDKALDDDTVRQRMFELGGGDLPKNKRGQRMLASLVKSEIARWNTILKAE